MKKISTAKVIVLSIVTLGVYTLIWLAKRRNEMVSEYKVKLPSNAWLVVFASLLALAIVTLITTAVLFALNIIGSVWTTIWLSVASLALPFALGLWWVIRFGKIFSKIVGGRVPLWWTIVFYIFLATHIIPVYQYFINRKTAKRGAYAEQVGPTRRFIVVSAIVAALFLILEIASWADLPATFNQMRTAFSETSQQDLQLIEKTYTLLKQHDACVNQLNIDYPDKYISAEDEAAYIKAYDACESIRLEQNAAVEALEK